MSTRRRVTRVTMLVSVLIVAGSVSAQDPDVIWATDVQGAPEQLVDVRVKLNNEALCQGWSVGLCHDPSLLSIVEVLPGETTSVISCDGDLPDFFIVDVLPGGFASGVVISFLGSCSLAPAGDLDLYRVVYELGPEEAVTTVDFCDTLGKPPVSTVIVHFGSSLVPIQVSGTITIGTSFRRGDCNDDGTLDLADSIFLESYLFVGGPTPDCESACDTNDDGLLDIADPISLLNWLFVDGPVPPYPFGVCDDDPTPDTLSCFHFDLGECP